MTQETIRLLVVEDNYADWRLIEEHLELLGADQVVHRQSLRDAIQYLEKETVDIILLDLNLPDTLGLAGLDHLQKQFPDIPVVILSGFASDDLMIAKESLRFGAQDFLSKTSLEAQPLHRSLVLAIERKRAEKLRAKAMLEDELTNLPRTHSLTEIFGRAVARAVRTDRKVGVIAVCVDNLRRIALEDGEDRGDELVRVMADRLQRALRGHDNLTRTSNGSFIALLSDLRNKSDIYDIARRLIDFGRKPLPELTLSQRVTLSVGLVLVDLAEDSFEQARERAENALKLAAEAGGDRFWSADAPIEKKPARKSVPDMAEA